MEGVSEKFQSTSTEPRILSKEEEDKLQKQNKKIVPEFRQNELERQAQKMWDLFYKRNKTNFFKDRHWTSREFEELKNAALQHEKLTILEAGCGVGNFLFPVLEEIPNLFVHACDFSPRAVQFVKDNIQYDPNRCNAFHCDLTKELCFAGAIPDNSIDMISLIFVLSAIHPMKFIDVFKNCCRILKPGGYILFRDYGLNDWAMLRFTAGNKLSENFYVRQDGTRAYYFTPELLENLINQTGFKVLSNEYVLRETVNKKEGLCVPRVFLQGNYVGHFRKPTGMNLLEIPYLDVVGLVTVLYAGFSFLRFVRRLWRESLWSQTLPFRKYGDWAVVTGSTDGIGKAIAFELAKCGLNVVLISRTQSKLDTVAEELRKDFGVEVKCVAVNFSDSDTIYDIIKSEIEGLSIAVLVNNVGTAQVKATALLDVPNHQKYSNDICRININAMLKMTEIVLPNMVEKKCGIVANISSIIGTKTSPYYAMYGPSKSMVIKFTEAMAYEYSGIGIKFQVISPAMTASALTGFQSNFLIPSSQEYGKYVVKSLGKSVSTNTSVFAHNFFQVTLQLLPDPLYAFALSKTREKK